MQICKIWDFFVIKNLDCFFKRIKKFDCFLKEIGLICKKQNIWTKL